MMWIPLNYIGLSSKYKYVYEYTGKTGGSKTIWFGIIGRISKSFETEKEAGKYVDLVLISQGKEPINVLKKA